MKKGTGSSSELMVLTLALLMAAVVALWVFSRKGTSSGTGIKPRPEGPVDVPGIDPDPGELGLENIMDLGIDPRPEIGVSSGTHLRCVFIDYYTEQRLTGYVVKVTYEPPYANGPAIRGKTCITNNLGTCLIKNVPWAPSGVFVIGINPPGESGNPPYTTIAAPPGYGEMNMDVYRT